MQHIKGAPEQTIVNTPQSRIPLGHRLLTSRQRVWLLAFALAAGSLGVLAIVALTFAGSKQGLALTGPDLVVTTTDAPDPAASGDAFTYTIRVRNIGDQSAATVGMINQPSPNFTYTGFSTTRGVCSLDGSVTGGTLDCDLGSFGTGPSAIATITVTGYVTTAVDVTVNDLATVDPGDVVLESNEANNTGAANTLVTAATPTTPATPTFTFTPTLTATPPATTPTIADLVVTNVAEPNPVVGSFPLTFVIDVRNVGGTPASLVRLIDTPPANFVYTGFEASTGSCTLVDSITGGELDCSLGTLAPGDQVTVLMHGYVQQQGNVTNAATVDPFDEVAEADESNNTASVLVVVTAPPTATPTLTPTPTLTFTPTLTSTPTLTFTPTQTFTPTPILPPGDLTISAVASVDPIVSGQVETYTVTIRNIGTTDVVGHIDTATGRPVPIHAFDQLPAGFALTGFSNDFGGTCLYTQNSRQLDCDFGTFHAGDIATITMTGTLTSSTDASVTNRALVDLPVSDAPEAIESTNNISVITTNVIGPTATPTPTATRTPTITNTPTPTNTPTITPTPTPMPWPCADFDGDGKVRVADILYVVNHYYTTDTATDLNSSGRVDVADILIAVQQYFITCPT